MSPITTIIRALQDGEASKFSYQKLCHKRHNNDIVARYCRKCREPFNHTQPIEIHTDYPNDISRQINAIRLPEGIENSAFVIDNNFVIMKQENNPYVSFDFREPLQKTHKVVSLISRTDRILLSTAFSTYFSSNQQDVFEISNAAFLNGSILENIEHCRERYIRKVYDHVLIQLFKVSETAVILCDKKDKTLRFLGKEGVVHCD